MSDSRSSKKRMVEKQLICVVMLSFDMNCGTRNLNFQRGKGRTRIGIGQQTTSASLDLR